MKLNYLKKWYFNNYEQGKIEIDRSVVARYSRGNVLVQEGHYISSEELESLSKRGDDAISNLEALAS